MARLRLLDRLQSFKFHLLDVSWSLAVPPFAFQPAAGFKAITAPEISLETEELSEGNYWFKRHLVTGGSIGNITLQRGASFYDAEFWRWMSAAIRGQTGGVAPPTMEGKRRNLLLIQYTGYSSRGIKDAGSAVDAAASAAAGLIPNVTGVLALPARAWLLMGCLPVRYKAASDFDAGTSDVSIMELELSVDRFEEFSSTG